MKPKIKKMWVEALRSGEYDQTQEYLRDCYGYCCLGVLCDLHRKVTGQGHWDKDNRYITETDDRNCALPQPVYEWAGFTRSLPRVYESENPDLVLSLSEMNDYGEMDFAWIAAIIETEL